MTRNLILAIALVASFWGAAAFAQDPTPQPTPMPQPTPLAQPTPTPQPTQVPQPEPLAATGKTAAVMVDVPVLTTPKDTNAVIRAEDLTTQQFPEKRIHGDIIRDSSQIIGTAARHQLQAGTPIRVIDIGKEQLVKRGEDVSIVFNDGSLEILASGKAQEGGAMGDTIKVTNLGSNHTVDATVIGDKKVKVTQ